MCIRDRYYVYNRVNNIDEVANHVAALVPEANVVFAHGQMHEQDVYKRQPFVVQGVMIGLVGALIPLAITYFLYRQAVVYMMERFDILSLSLIHICWTARFRLQSSRAT